MKHYLKTRPYWFELSLSGSKAFEIRNSDRGFKKGDIVILREYNHDKEKYTGREIAARITCVTDFHQKPGYVVFGLNRMVNI